MRIVKNDGCYDNQQKIVTVPSQGDNCLGIAIAFDVEYYADNSESVGVINTSTQGEDGVGDMINQVTFIGSSFPIKEVLVDSHGDSLYKMKRENFLSGRDYVCSPDSKELFVTHSFVDIEDFIVRYNDREKDLVIRDNLEREFFFWLERDVTYNVQKFQNLKLKIVFSDEREVLIEMN